MYKFKYQEVNLRVVKVTFYFFYVFFCIYHKYILLKEIPGMKIIKFVLTNNIFSHFTQTFSFAFTFEI